MTAQRKSLWILAAVWLAILLLQLDLVCTPSLPGGLPSLPSLSRTGRSSTPAVPGVDTVFLPVTVYLERERIVYKSVPAKVRYLEPVDSLTPPPAPFVAVLDSVSGDDTVHVEFVWPAMRFENVLWSLGPDTVTQTVPQIITTTVVEETSWLEKAGLVGIGVAAGVIGGYVAGSR